MTWAFKFNCIKFICTLDSPWALPDLTLSAEASSSPANDVSCWMSGLRELSLTALGCDVVGLWVPGLHSGLELRTMPRL